MVPPVTRTGKRWVRRWSGPRPDPARVTAGPPDPRQLLLNAVMEDDATTVRRLLDAGGFPPSPEPAGPDPSWSPAAEDLLRLLNGNAQGDLDPAGILDRAVQRGHPEVVSALLEHWPHGQAAFPRMGSVAVLTALQARGWVMDPTSLNDRLHQAVAWSSDATALQDRLELIGRFCDLGGSLEQRDARGRTVLLAALEFDHRPDRTTLSMAHQALDREQMALVLGLIGQGADVNAVGPDGSALLVAISPLGWTSGVVSALVERGATLVHPRATAARPAPMDEEQDGLTRAVRSGEIGLVEQCLALGVDVNRPGTLSWWGDAEDARMTPLMMAVSQGFDAAIDRLVEAGANVQAALDHAFWGEELRAPATGEQNDPVRDERLRAARLRLEQALLRQCADAVQRADEPGPAGGRTVARRRL